MISVSVSAG